MKKGLLKFGMLLAEIVCFAVISIVCLIGLFMIMSAFGVTDDMFVDNEAGTLGNPYKMLLREFLPQLIIFSGATWLVSHIIFKRPLATTGFNKQGIVSEFSYGYLFAFILVLVGFLFLVSTDLMDIVAYNWDGALFFGFLLFFIIQSAGEEVVSRSFLLPAVESRFGSWAGLIVSSAFFSIMHYFNPNVIWTGLLNIFLGGMLMGLLFIKYRNIWAPTGLHASWNFVQGSVFGFEVSGHEIYSYMDTVEKGNDLITGGKFGYEGSIISVLVLFISCIMMLWLNPGMMKNIPDYKSIDEPLDSHPTIV